MNAFEAGFQFLATLYIKLCNILRFSVITQFRIVHGAIATVQTIMSIIGLYLFTAVSIYFPGYNEALFAIFFIYTLIISIYTANQWKISFSDKITILSYLNEEETSDESRVELLSKLRLSYTYALVFSAMLFGIFWPLLGKNTELLSLILIPAMLDVLANGIATAWEITTLNEPIAKPAVDI
ncbi:MAG: hypothetical protein P1P90_05615 [Patescibacteria group bacterium]|nr:hypothetical protein [Patescibacteria group bacterium]